MYLCCETSYVAFDKLPNRETTNVCINRVKAIEENGYEDFKKRHIAVSYTHLVRCMRLKGGLAFEADRDFEINVSQYTSEMLTNASHTDELEKCGNTIVRIDYKVSGIGSNSCGPELIEKYRLNEKEINFNFVMKKSEYM